MGFKSRKLFIWLISLVAVLAVYLLYSRLSKTPQIDIDTPAEFTDTVTDSNVGESRQGGVGMIGDVGVGTVRKAKYIHLNKDKQVDREFGFEKLLHEVGNEWEIEKPYMNIFQRRFKCYITADKGEVQVETAAGRPSPKDAKLTGNVVIHILPESGSNIKESFVYLDDVVFISEKSLFSTAGPVKFVSQDAQMLGTGLEFVYNNELDRLEFLRIIHLESLRLKNSQAALFASGQQKHRGTKGQRDKGYKQQTMSDERRAPPLSGAGRATNYYRCVFSKNVIINTPGQMIFADEVSINNIFFSKASSKKSGNEASLESRVQPLGGEGRQMTDGRQQTTENRGETKDEEFVDIVVTCDDGIVVTSMDSPRVHKNSAKLDTAATVPDTRGSGDFDDTSPVRSRRLTSNGASGRATFVAPRIEHDASTGDTIASGPSELTFYVNDVMAADANEAAVPVKITAREKTKFSPALNLVSFEGDCLCTMLRQDPDSQQKYTLSAPKLTVDLTKGKDKLSSALAADVEHITADGGVVKLAIVKTAEEKLLGGIELKCHRFDFDTGQPAGGGFLATGPGVIKFDNSGIPEPDKKVGRFSLQRPCWALVEDFDTLKYYLDANQVIADAESQQIHIGYVPIIKGEYGQRVSATASHIETVFYETAGGRNELSTLSATGGITYEDEDNQFAGGEMFYDANKSIITVQGDEDEPCYFNGALVDGIEYDLKTGKVKAQIIGPGVLQMKR